jgi:guanine nucleotide-binding protein G(i) subunit alpha
MGIISSRRKQDPVSKEIDRQLQQEVEEDTKVIKLLLLGAGESGKSTLFKQAIKLYGKGFSEQALQDYSRGITENVLTSMGTLVRESLARGGECAVNEDAAAAVQFFRDVEQKLDYTDITEEAARHVKTLWADEGIQRTWATRTEFQVPEAVHRFFDDIDRLADPKFVPNHQDVLHCRARTTGIVETEFEMNKTQSTSSHFKIMDVGGQRSERKKWVHCFEDVMAVLFVAAISEYDQTCFEDGSTNRVMEALELFDQVCNEGWFSKASIILFLNKRDLFAEKIEKVNLNVLFDDYTGGNDYEKGVEFLKQKFAARNTTEGVELFTHVTCATDEKNVEFTFDAVKMIVLNNSLGDAGLQ